MKKWSKDPAKINNYNKFLCTLDQTCSFIKREEKERSIEEKESNMKELIDKILAELDMDFEKKELYSTKFTGQTEQDMKMMQKKEKVSISIKIPVHHVNIDAEINTIDDILKLIDTYPIDPSIQYNINMQSLHNIKRPLQELQHMIGMTHLKVNIVEQILYFVQDLHKGETR